MNTQAKFIGFGVLVIASIIAYDFWRTNAHFKSMSPQSAMTLAQSKLSSCALETGHNAALYKSLKLTNAQESENLKVYSFVALPDERGHPTVLIGLAFRPFDFEVICSHDTSAT
jgi:hypothetical protein